MSVVINTNFAATVAASNLARSNESLQKSLNRLSSGSKIVNPSDDAGGLAVAMKLTATARRSAATALNLSNAVSMLQTQDGVMKTVGKVLDRMSELWTLYRDPTKNTNDLANYSAEFSQLQKELDSLTDETFNGKNLFGTTNIMGPVSASEDGSSAIITFTTKNLTDTSTGVGSLLPDISSADAQAAMDAAFATFKGTSMNAAAITAFKDVVAANVTANAAKTALDSAIDDYAAGCLDATNTVTQNNALDQALDSAIIDASATPKAGGCTLATVPALTTITTAIQNVATMRANNGAEQSRLGFASEVLSINKSNLEAASSRIMDVDVAEESTQLARWNVLVQAGTAMLAQANQSPQSVLKLLS